MTIRGRFQLAIAGISRSFLSSTHGATTWFANVGFYMDAFWELLRILYLERPQTLSDAIRFEHLKLMVYTGFRVVEAVRVPYDCLVEREYFDYLGRRPSERMGIDRSLRLMYFAEKQSQDRDATGMVLVVEYQDVPKIFEQPVREIVERTRRLTDVMRNRLRQQIETERLFPELDPDALIRGYEAYIRISGNIRISQSAVPNSLAEAYRDQYSLESLRAIRDHQLACSREDISPRIREQLVKWRRKAPWLQLYDEKTRLPTLPYHGGRYLLNRFWHWPMSTADCQSGIRSGQLTALANRLVGCILEGPPSSARPLPWQRIRRFNEIQHFLT